MKILARTILSIVVLFQISFVAGNNNVKAASIKDPVANPTQISYDSSLVIGSVPIQRVGAQFDVPIKVIYGDKKICAVKAYLSFPPNMLEVVSLTHGPLFNLEVIKSYSNAAGTVSYALAPGSAGCLSESATVYTVKFKTKLSGNAPVKFGNVSVVSSNDGIGYTISTYRIESTVWINNDFADIADKISKKEAATQEYRNALPENYLKYFKNHSVANLATSPSAPFSSKR